MSSWAENHAANLYRIRPDRNGCGQTNLKLGIDNAVFLPVESVNGASLGDLVQAVTGLTKPVIFRDAVGPWPAVRRGRESLDDLIAYIKACDNGVATETFRQESGADGKYFYSDDQKTLNFVRAQVPISETLGQLPDPRHSGRTTCLDRKSRNHPDPLRPAI